MAPNDPIWPLLIYCGAVIALIAAMMGLSSLLGERSATKATNEPFESGIVSVGDARGRFPIKFFLMAIFFVIFDVESIFIFAWAIAFRRVGWTGYFALLVFIGILFAALVYLWRTGGLDWNVHSEKAQRRVTNAVEVKQTDARQPRPD